MAIACSTALIGVAVDIGESLPVRVHDLEAAVQRLNCPVEGSGGALAEIT